MALYRVSADSFVPVEQASFVQLGIRERADLQRLLRTQIEVLDDDLFVLAEEFGDWEDSHRRVDLLAIDKEANLVVIEIKRTNDGGHMELQATRYASMVSAMTFERAEQVHRKFLSQIGANPEAARERLLSFPGWDEPDEEAFAEDVRIVLVSEDFGRELTTAVLWLREHEVDVRCVRLRPFRDGDANLIDVQQIIPLPEAAEYQVQLREKEQVGRKQRAEVHELRLRFWEGLVAIARRRGTRHANRKPGHYHWLGGATGIRGLSFNYVVAQDHGIAELYIDRGDSAENKRIFDALHSSKLDIEKEFGGTLSWERLEARRASRVKSTIDRGGYQASESDWPAIQEEMVEAMARLENALLARLERLGVG